MSEPWSSSRLLAVDSASPILSVAVGSVDEILARRWRPAERSSSVLMRLVDECLEEARVPVQNLTGALVLRGPGSFTGLRVGMALLMGLHQSLGFPVASLGTFDALAAVPEPAESPVLAAVKAGRREWMIQRFGSGPPRKAVEAPRRIPERELAPQAAGLTIVGFGLESLDERSRPESTVTPPPLAPLALGLASRADWDAASLANPFYSAPAPARRPQAPDPRR